MTHIASPEDAEDSSTAVSDPSAASTATADAVFVLTVMDGPDKGRSFNVDAGQAVRVLIGKGPACAIQLGDPEVSRRHAALEPVGPDLRLTDLGSTNGTVVDRVKIVEVLLRGGERVRVGSTLFNVRRGEAPADAPPPAEGFGRLVGSSPEMRRLYPLCRRLADTDVPVIIEGETGTGKEVLAEALHERGPRASGPFVVFDCTLVAPSLIESELFGHERGAFTGALGSRTGVFEQAQGGTLFLDEIGDLDLSLQPKLLRALERSEIRRVGGDRWIKVDVRLLCATRRDLDREVQARRFREDLFHRLSVARAELPPLRHRRGDVTVLARHFWKQLGGDPALLTEDLLARWDAYPWPGNVRELRNSVARQVALGDLADQHSRGVGGIAPEAAAPATTDFLEQVVESGAPFSKARSRVLEEFQHRYVAHVLDQHGGDLAKAAAASGIGRRYFQMLRARQAKGGRSEQD